MSKYAAFVDELPEFRIKNGVVHIRQVSGESVMESCMSISTFRRTVERGRVVLAEWALEQHEVIQLHVDPRCASGRDT